MRSTNNNLRGKTYLFVMKIRSQCINKQNSFDFGVKYFMTRICLIMRNFFLKQNVLEVATGSPLRFIYGSCVIAIKCWFLFIECQNALLPGEGEKLNLHSTTMILGKQFCCRWRKDNTASVTPGTVQVMKWPANLTCRFMHAVINLPLLLD